MKFIGKLTITVLILVVVNFIEFSIVYGLELEVAGILTTGEFFGIVWFCIVGLVWGWWED